MKYRINFTAEDYFDYVGTNPYYPLKKRVMESIPYEFRDSSYNLKFKIIKDRSWSYKKWYRVHFSVDMEESRILEIFKRYEDYCHKPEEWSYKVIKRPH